MADQKNHGQHNRVAAATSFQVGWYLVQTDAKGKNPSYSFRGNGDKPSGPETRTMYYRFFYGQRFHKARPAHAKDYKQVNRKQARNR